MFKILLGNILFAGCVAAWYFYADGDHGLMLSGAILAFGCFLSGILMGYLLRGPGNGRRRVYRTPARSFEALDAPADEMEPEETEAEVEPLEPDRAVESNHIEEEQVEPPIAVAASIAGQVEIELVEEVVPPLVETPPPPISVPQAAPMVEIHEPAAKVVLDSDGCYEMVVQSEPPPFTLADLSAVNEPKGVESSSRRETTPDTSEFTL